MKERRLWLPIAVLATIAVFILTGSAVLMAAHTGGDVTLKDASGNPVTGTTPYSPKKTCGLCHNYGSGSATVSKVQGYANSSGKVAFDTYNVTTFTHGVSIGKHSNEGRGEEWTAALRTVWGAPASTSSPGMWGRY